MNMKNYGRNDKAYAESMENISKRNQLNPLENYNRKSNSVLDEESMNIVNQINNKDRVNDILSGNGLQLPELKAESDPIFNYSISNSAEKINTPITDYKKVKINNHDDFK